MFALIWHKLILFLKHNSSFFKFTHWLNYIKCVPLLSIVLILTACDDKNSINNFITISKLPFVIKNAGYYKLVSDLEVKDKSDGIVISSNDVIIDLNGKEIHGPSDPKSGAIAIYANQVSNVKIRNGTISGFFYGIRIDGGSSGENTQNIDVSNIIAKNNYFRGIAVEGENTIISNNQILNTGGSTFFPDSFAFGIEVKGKNAQVIKNKIDGIFPIGIGEGVGISLSNTRAGNIVSDNIISTPIDSKATFGIWIVGDTEETKTLITSNKISGFYLPFNILRDFEKNSPIFSGKIFTGLTIRKNLNENNLCNPTNHHLYYSDLDNSNEFLANNNFECPQLVGYLEKQMLKTPDDPRAIYRLAQSLEHCNATPTPNQSECFKMKEKSIVLLQRCAKLGLQEAKRILDRDMKN